MVYGIGLGALLELCLIVYCLLDVLRTPGAQVRNLPKPVWAILCFIPPVVGPVCWLLFGRPIGGIARAPRPGAGSAPSTPERRRTSAQSPDDDEAFLASLRERAEEQRRRAAEQAKRLRDEEQPPPV